MKIKDVESYLRAENIYESKKETMTRFPKKMKDEEEYVMTDFPKVTIAVPC
jgi:hypothetical protein